MPYVYARIPSKLTTIACNQEPGIFCAHLFNSRHLHCTWQDSSILLTITIINLVFSYKRVRSIDSVIREATIVLISVIITANLFSTIHSTKLGWLVRSLLLTVFISASSSHTAFYSITSVLISRFILALRRDHTLSPDGDLQAHSFYVSDMSRLEFASLPPGPATSVLELTETSDNSELPQYRDHGDVYPGLPMSGSVCL